MGREIFFLVIYREIRLCGSTLYVGSAQAHELLLQGYNFYCDMQIVGIVRNKKFRRDFTRKVTFYLTLIVWQLEL